MCCFLPSVFPEKDVSRFTPSKSHLRVCAQSVCTLFETLSFLQCFRLTRPYPAWPKSLPPTDIFLRIFRDIDDAISIFEKKLSVFEHRLLALQCSPLESYVLFFIFLCAKQSLLFGSCGNADQFGWLIRQCNALQCSPKFVQCTCASVITGKPTLVVVVIASSHQRLQILSQAINTIKLRYTHVRD